MAIILMPRLSDSMEAGTVLNWLMRTGTVVATDQDVVEIETDKATVTQQAGADGELTIFVREGETVGVGTPIAAVGEDPVQIAALANGHRAIDGDAPLSEQDASAGPSVAGDSPPTVAAAGSREGRGASPVARRLAQELAIDLATVVGTGPRGRVLKVDVQTARDRGPAADAAAAASEATTSGTVEVAKLSRSGMLVARRMAESRATIPDFDVTVEVDMDPATALRGELRAILDQALPSFNDMIIKACGLALREFPRANGSYREDAIELHPQINVGVAVAAQDVLVVPTVFDADTRTLTDIAVRTRRFAERARRGEITPSELAGGTFTISNLGMFGVTQFTAVVNSSQAAILAVGAVQPRPVVRDGQIVVRNTMNLTLACDHRVLYGADAAAFLSRVRALLESPLGLLVG